MEKKGIQKHDEATSCSKNLERMGLINGIKEQIQGTNETLPPRFELDSASSKLTVRGSLKSHFLKQLKMTGSKNLDFADLITQQLVKASHSGDEISAMNANGALAALGGIEPRDELEGMLGAQMVAAHSLAMECMSRATNGTNLEAVSANVDRAVKLMRTYTTQIEALNRYRGKGQQKVTVEHVTVNQGGQAVIGVVEAKTTPGGSTEEDRRSTPCKAVAKSISHEDQGE